jgi:hypothetical protein
MFTIAELLHVTQKALRWKESVASSSAGKPVEHNNVYDCVTQGIPQHTSPTSKPQVNRAVSRKTRTPNADTGENIRLVTREKKQNK